MISNAFIYFLSLVGKAREETNEEKMAVGLRGNIGKEGKSGL